MIQHSTMPNIVGNIADMTVGRMPMVSFFMVRSVVAQGQWKRAKVSIHTAVFRVQPFCTSNRRTWSMAPVSDRVDADIYVISIMGMTISLAGVPSIKAISITPSSPNMDAKGWRKREHTFSMHSPLYDIFDISHMTRPAGTATATALPNTKSVLSATERMMMSPIFGLRYGGISSAYDDGIPLRTECDKINVAVKVANIHIVSTAVRTNAQFICPNTEFPAAKNILATDIRIGNFPLHGMNEFVSMASMRSLGESIILHPTTPAALHPNPIHIVRACFPQALHFLKGRSRL